MNKLRKDDTEPKVLKYPVERTDQFKSKIVFQPYEVIGSDFSFTETNNNIDTSTAEGIAAASAKKLKTDSNSGKILGGLSAITLNKLENEKTELFLPLQFQVRDGIQYGDAQLGLAGGQAYGAISGGQGLQEGLVQGIQELGNSVADLFGTLSGSGQLGKLAAARAAQLPGIPQIARDIVGLAGRVTINPNARTVFNGVNIRDFTFQFDFFPKSEAESRMVHYIVRRFRINAYPESIGGKGPVPVGYKYPNLYGIRLLSGSNGDRIFRNVGTPIKLSYLQSVDTSYGRQQGEGLFKNGAPTHVQLTLVFKEYKALDRQDIINEDYSDGEFRYEPSKAAQ